LRILVLAAALFGLTGCYQRRIPDRYILPDGYTGWVKLDYIVKDAPPLPIEDGYRVVRFSADGYAETSSESLRGWASDRFEYANGDELPEEKVFVRFDGAISARQWWSPGQLDHGCSFIGTPNDFRSARQGCQSPGWPIVTPTERIPLRK